MNDDMVEKLVMVSLLGPAFILFGVIFFIVGLSSLTSQKKVIKWESTNGVVVSSDLKTESTFLQGRTSHTYQKLVDYEYEWQGTTYKGKRSIFVGDESAYEEWHEKNLAQDCKIKVWVDPYQPNQSTLVARTIGSKKEVAWPFLIFGYAVMNVFLVLARDNYPRFKPILNIVLQVLFIIMVGACIYAAINSPM